MVLKRATSSKFSGFANVIQRTIPHRSSLFRPFTPLSFQFLTQLIPSCWQQRMFSSINSVHVPSIATQTVDSFSEINFHKICDSTLEQLGDALSELDSELEDVDINLSQGVLSVNLGPVFSNKTWVINKQTPNRQIWWSSPVSGPRRYEFVGDKNGNGSKKGRSSPLASDWRFSKNSDADLWTDLKSELLHVTKVELTHPDE